MNIIRNKILNCINRYDPKKLYFSEHEPELELDLRNTQRFMKENMNIFITKSDKGNKVVLMYKVSYLDKMIENLSDDTQYEKVQRNSLSQIIEKTKSLIEKVTRKHPKNAKRREKKQNNKINIDIDSTNFSRAYGLPKIHKIDYPFRIIVSSINSPFHQSPKLLSLSISRSCRETGHYLKDIWTLKQDLQGIIIPPNHITISFDVVKLLPSITLQLIMIAIEKRWHDIENHTLLSKDEFLEAVELIFNNFYLQFRYNLVNSSMLGRGLK
ncbi:hypothetical protein QAD02_021856 [Eretmocerus hayati]|uniref:Uncharacterized protein n=1 Tax=Eretmocerus hayati TaxID=131215 RepID=A0ACC2PRF1_9HYME|nr:hypothetical protein QAD02_021856 [Eretmocerus hayati]